MKDKIAHTLRWVARIQSIASILFFLFFFIGETFFMPESAAEVNTSFMGRLPLYLFISAIAGLLLAWKWEIAGALLCLSALSALAVLNVNVLSSPLLLYVLNGILFLLPGLLEKRMNSSTKA